MSILKDKKLLFISLGCDKNLVDSEFMIGMLTNEGVVMCDDETEADIIIINIAITTLLNVNLLGKFIYYTSFTFHN